MLSTTKMIDKKYFKFECTDNRTLKILRVKEVVDCCIICAKRKRRGYYHLGWAYKNNKHQAKYPSWKLVSKNPKQWMEKPLVIKKHQIRWTGEIDQRFYWSGC